MLLANLNAEKVAFHTSWCRRFNLYLKHDESS